MSPVNLKKKFENFLRLQYWVQESSYELISLFQNYPYCTLYRFFRLLVPIQFVFILQTRKNIFATNLGILNGGLMKGELSFPSFPLVWIHYGVLNTKKSNNFLATNGVAS